MYKFSRIFWAHDLRNVRSGNKCGFVSLPCSQAQHEGITCQEYQDDLANKVDEAAMKTKKFFDVSFYSLFILQKYWCTEVMKILWIVFRIYIVYWFYCVFIYKTISVTSQTSFHIKVTFLCSLIYKTMSYTSQTSFHIKVTIKTTP